MYVRWSGKAVGLVLAAGLALLAAPQPAALGADRAGDERPAVRIGGEYFGVKALLGKSEQELRAEFDREAAWMTTEQLRSRVEGTLPPTTAPLQAGRTRDMLSDALFRRVLLRAVHRAVELRYLAGVTDEIVAKHGVVLSDYFDVEKIREGLVRYSEFGHYVELHGHDGPAGMSERYALVRNRFKITYSEANWGQGERIAAGLKSFDYWEYYASDEALKRDDIAVKAVIAHSLLEDACQTGVYARRGLDVFRFRVSGIEETTISGYEGPQDSLAALVAEIVDKDGDVDLGGLGTLKKWLKRLSPRLQVETANVPGSSLMQGPDLPPIAVLFRSGPDDYRIFGWASHFPSLPGLALPARHEAYNLAGQEFGPVLESVTGGPDIQTEAIRDVLSMPGATYVAGMVEMSGFIKRPYLSAPFDEMEMARPQLQDFAIQAARAELRADAPATARLAAAIRERANAATSAAVKYAFGQIASELATRTSLPAGDAGREPQQ